MGGYDGGYDGSGTDQSGVGEYGGDSERSVRYFSCDDAVTLVPMPA